MKEKTAKTRLKGDGIIWAVFFLLCIISVVEVFSASSNLTYKTDSYWGPVIKHTVLLVVGLGFLVATMNMKCKYFKLVTPFALFISFISLLACFALGEVTNGAQRWIPIFGFQFQPSELAKGAVVFAVAQILSAMQTEHGADKRACKYVLSLTLVFVCLIGVENLSTAALLFAVVLLMMWIGRVPKHQLGKIIGVITILVVLTLSTIMALGNDTKKDTKKDERMTMVDKADKEQVKEEKTIFEKVFHRFDTWKGRIDHFMDGEEVPPEEFDLKNESQVGYSNIAIASSNIVGKGPGNSTERDYLPQAFSDFIYAIIVEEMGLLGAFFVCFLYIILLFRTSIIAGRCVNTFPALLIMGCALLLVTQALFNMGVAVGWLPVTGQPLPLISKGGTSTIVNCVYIGTILSVSISAKKKDDPAAASSVKVTI